MNSPTHHARERRPYCDGQSLCLKVDLQFPIVASPTQQLLEAQLGSVDGQVSYDIVLLHPFLIAIHHDLPDRIRGTRHAFTVPRLHQGVGLRDILEHRGLTTVPVITKVSVPYR